MRCAAVVLLLFLAAPALAQLMPVPPSVFRPDVNAGIRPPPEPRSVMRERPGESAVADELHRLGIIDPGPAALAGRDVADVAGALHRASPPPQPIAAPPGVDLRGAPPSAAAIVSALQPR